MAPRPHYASEFESLFGVAPRFHAESNCLTFDAKVLDLEQPLAEEHAFRYCERQCRELIDQRNERAGIAGRVRGRILRDRGELQVPGEVAIRARARATAADAARRGWSPYALL